jgi:hypothetical protein
MKNVSIKKIKEQLEAGMSREEIIEDINNNLPEGRKLNPAEIKFLWQQPELKGVKKAKYKIELIFVEDEENTNNSPVAQTMLDLGI